MFGHPNLVTFNSNLLMLHDLLILCLGQCQLSNVNQYIQWSNRLSHIVASEIVSCQKVADRCEMIEFFMDAALICCRLGNFNSCVSITGKASKAFLSLRLWLQRKFFGHFFRQNLNMSSECPPKTVFNGAYMTPIRARNYEIL